MKKRTVQDIADKVGISRVTVWKAMNGQKGVSESTRQRILQTAYEMGYGGALPAANPQAAAAGQKVSYIAVIVARPESSVFWMKIINQISAELSRHNLHCIYVNLVLDDLDNFKMPAVIQNGEVQGMIVVNAYDERVLRILAQSELPKVFMDRIAAVPFQEMNGDVILLDGRNPVCEITEQILQSGRTEIGFIGDIEYAVSNHTRWDGFCAAMQSSGVPINKTFCLTSGFQLDNYREVMEEFIRQLPILPQAFVCVNDYTAYILISILTQKGCRIPEDIAVSGYDNNPELLADDSLLTTVDVQKGLLGKRLVQQLLYRIENPEADYEMVSIHSKVCLKKSTDFSETK